LEGKQSSLQTNDFYEVTMKTRMQDFLNDDTGAVTVDWVVLTAAIVGLGLAVIASIGRGTADMSTGLNSHLMTQDVTVTY